MNFNPLNKVFVMKARTGTKLVIINYIITIGLIIFLIIGLPFLAIKWNIFVTVIEKMNISNIIIALLGQSGLSTIANEIRKAIENRTKKLNNGENNGIN
ncbi:MAG: hypothetical protein KAX49_13730 [Halanaerobiales bacterium]|nr:hypothetical protein [Halanaerobiales bacterium]